MLHNTIFSSWFTVFISRFRFFFFQKKRKEHICCSFPASSHKKHQLANCNERRKNRFAKKKVFLFDLCQVYDGLCAMPIEWYRITLKYTCDMRVNDLRNQTFCLFTRSLVLFLPCEFFSLFATMLWSTSAILTALIKMKVSL